ncbi:MAG: sensor domain-containing diguanylate cyclase [Fimbriimonas sp.]
MHHDPFQPIRALFVWVLACDGEGRVVQSIGEENPPENVFEYAPFRRLHGPLREALAGRPFEATVPGERHETVRVRAVPVPGDGPAQLAISVEPCTPSADALMDGGLNPTEMAFLVRHMRQGLWRLDPEERIVDANEYVAAWLGTTPAQLIGTYADRWRPSGGGSPRMEAEFIDANGHRKRGVVFRSESPASSDHCHGAIELICDMTSEHALKAKLVEEVRRMSQLARTDALTGLPNRMAFEERMTELRTAGKPFALLVVDLDDLKAINDEQGHAHGDQAIVEIGSRLRETLRTTDVVARIGGDEFAAILPNTSQDDAAMILERLRERLEDVDSENQIRASVGLAHSADGLDDVAKSADDAMYRHKRSRKGGN